MDNQTTNEPLSAAPIPPDDLRRNFKITASDDEAVPHLGLVGDTYTILLSGSNTDGRYCLIDMQIPPGGGPPPHRHDFEESFTVLAGEIEATFRGNESVVKTGQTLHIPANAPHFFKNISGQPARLLCICSPAGQEAFFEQVGVRVKDRITQPPKLDEVAQMALEQKAEILALKYKTEMLKV